MLLVLSLVSILNNETGFIAEKVASFAAYDIYQGTNFTLGFFVQYILLWIPFELFDDKYAAHGLNMGLQAFTFMLGARFVFNMKSSWMLALFTLFPSYYHYSIFGLRDPLINLVVVLVVIAAMRQNTKQFVITCMALSVLSIGIRAELSMILMGFAGIKMYFDVSGAKRLLLILAGIAALYVALLILPLAFGVPSTGSVAGNIDSMVQFNELRNERRLGEYGSGSHILGGALYGYQFGVRYPVQIGASFLAPLPVDIRSSLDALALFESVLFIFAAFCGYKAARLNQTSLILFCCGIAYMLLQAIFAINYGNILRVRYPCLIIFLCLLYTSPSPRDRTRSRMPSSA